MSAPVDELRTRTGRGWAYTGALLGGAVSIAANVAHSYVPPTDAPPSWAPPAGAVIGAVFWPAALFVAIEVLARVAWPDGRRWVAVRYLGLLPVALVAAVVSYRHLSGLLAWYREDPLTVVIGPLAVDGLMVMATGALIATGRRHAARSSAQAAQADPYVRELCAAIREQSRLAVHRTGQYRITAGPLLSTTPFLTAHAAQVERTDASDQGQPASEEAADGPAGPRTDAELLAELRAQDLDLSTLTRYRVEKLTGAASRQAQRLLDVLLTAPEQTAQTPEPAPTNGHAVPALAGRAHVHTEES